MRRRIIRILEDMQSWRRGDDVGMPFSPVVFGIAIDVAIKVLENTSDKKFEKIINEQKNVSGFKETIRQAFL